MEIMDKMIIKRFIAGGCEYRIRQDADGNGFHLEKWEETNYDEGYWELMYTEDDMEEMHRHYEDILEAGAEIDMNL